MNNNAKSFRVARWLGVCGLLAFGLASAPTGLAQEKKTNPARDVFVEDSATNFVLVAKAPEATGKQKLTFELSPKDPGDYMLVVFVDGRPMKPQEFKAPGKFELSTRGMAPGTYRVTLQLADAQGRVGKVTRHILVK